MCLVYERRAFIDKGIPEFRGRYNLDVYIRAEVSVNITSDNIED